MKRIQNWTWPVIVSLTALPHLAVAEFFGSSENRFEIEFVTIGDPGNAADPKGLPGLAGAVDYVYKIGKYEISRDIIEKATAEGNLGLTLLDMSEHGGNDPQKPATGISWFEAATFVNWLNSSKGHPEAYKFTDGVFELWQVDDVGYDQDNAFRNRLAHYFLPNVDEWYKAAFYDPQTGDYFRYATGSNTDPVPVVSGTDAGTAVHYQRERTGPAEVTQAGGLSAYGTMGQSGNVWEWEETEFDLSNDNPISWRGLRGGSWGNDANHVSSSYRNPFAPSVADWFYSFGFRVASVAESVFTIGDFDFSGERDLLDVNRLNQEIAAATHDTQFDLNSDNLVDGEDLRIWVKDLKNTWFGDGDLDGRFMSSDLIDVLQQGKFETGADATWDQGDWTGDLRFDSSDLVAAFQDGGYEQGTRTGGLAVPEASSGVLFIVGLLCLSGASRLRALDQTN